MRFTDGAYDLMRNLQCYWLGEAILSHMLTNTRLRMEPIVFWELRQIPHPDNGYHWLLRAHDGDRGPGEVELARQRIEYTDLPEEITLLRIWVAKDSEGEFTAMVPEEY